MVGGFRTGSQLQMLIFGKNYCVLQNATMLSGSGPKDTRTMNLMLGAMNWQWQHDFT